MAVHTFNRQRLDCGASRRIRRRDVPINRNRARRSLVVSANIRDHLMPIAMQRWEQVYNELQRKAEKLGYRPPTQIGGVGSQVFEFRVGKEATLLLAFRDLARKEDYKVKNRLWAEGLELVL